MADESSWTSHVLAGATWRRFAFMLIFVPILSCALFLMGFTSLFQFFSMLASGETNPQLTSFGHGLARFAAEIMDYLTYNTERRPFPFAGWQGAERSPRRRSRPASERRKRKVRSSSRRRGATEPVVRLNPPSELRPGNDAQAPPEEPKRPPE
ncbi:MAG TPA: DUF4389 domain-containing protein [Gammaproteobacteria bacterium]|nr:DUF4389 domain-containing protein [Gammaproteobacteria bacterium]